MAEIEIRESLAGLVNRLGEYKQGQLVTSGLSDSLFTQLSGLIEADSIPDSLTEKPSAEAEARVIADFCFFWSDLQRVARDDAQMKEIMVESSSRLADWLTIRDAVGGSDVYNVLINFFTPQPDTQLPAPSQPTPHTSTFLERLRHVVENDIATIRQEETIAEPSVRKIANTITHSSFRNTPVLENIHSGLILATDHAMEELKTRSVAYLINWLSFRDDPEASEIFDVVVNDYHDFYCSSWEL